MIFTPTGLAGAYVLEMEKREDSRGFFARSWCAKELEEHGLNPKVAQVNVGFSAARGTLRGLHYQLPPWEEVKIVHCTQGSVFDVIVDLRPNSATWKRWVGVELTAENRKMLYVPEGCAHGYQTLTEGAELVYQTSQFYAPEFARGIRHDDRAFSIKWPLPVEAISDADRDWPLYSV